MIQHLSLMAIGVSIFCATILVFAHLLSPVYSDMVRARLLGCALLVDLVLLQLLHFHAINGELLLWTSRLYVGSMFCTGPLFYFFCRAVLYPSRPEASWKLAAIVPPLVGAAAPGEPMFFASFFIGSGYFALLAYELISLRSQRRRFAVELAALVTLFMVAGMTLILGMLMPLLGHQVFVAVFALLNGLSFLPAMMMVVRYPDLLSRVEEAVQMARASTTLSTVNVSDKLELLRQLMQVDRLFMDENLNLTGLAEQLSLSTHQTSELLNHQLGTSFTHYVRKLRVDEARRQLVDEPTASVLAIALEVGFSSQSTFYTAFKAEQGVSPGRYRQQATTEKPA